MKAKNLIVVVGICFLLFWMFQDPSGLADSSESLVTSLWRLTSDLFSAVLDFVRALG